MKCPHYFTLSEDTGHILIGWNNEKPSQIFMWAQDIQGVDKHNIVLHLNKAAKIGFDARAEVIKQVLEIK
jgi:hypothetical protein